MPKGKSEALFSVSSDDADPDPDPVVATYPVFAQPPLPSSRKLLILQYPNSYSAVPGALKVPDLSELRIKPATGLVEVDVPIDTAGTQYDRKKGVAWGTALKKTLAAKEGGSLGLAGGFGLGAPVARGGGRRRRGDDDDDGQDAGMPWGEALRNDAVLRTRTLGGRAAEEEDANYMVGVFQNKAIHLTPVNALVHLRPILPHLDAAAEQDRPNRSSTGGPGGSAASDSKTAAPARAIHMTLKSAMADGGGVALETMTDRLKAVQTEPWRRMAYTSDDYQDSWEKVEEYLVLHQKQSEQKNNKNNPKGKQPAASSSDATSAQELMHTLPHLQSQWCEEQLLRRVSGREDDLAEEHYEQAENDKLFAPITAPVLPKPQHTTTIPIASRKRTATATATALAQSTMAASSASEKQAASTAARDRWGGVRGPRASASNAMELD